ncbi:MAG: N-acetyl-gamma-glutamyl-phosphate reductase [Steroidobacteraceae bacterium]
MPGFPVYVLGGSGYVAGEAIRLILGHPQLQLAGVASDGQPGTPVELAFPHLAPRLDGQLFLSYEALAAQAAGHAHCGVISAAPHGASARLIASLLTQLGATTRVSVVDLSADFRFADPAAYELTYGHAHGAPDLQQAFTCAVPEHLPKAGTRHVAHPGCFSTAILLASVPLLALDLVEPQLWVSAVTGSTGSGRQPTEGTHHPRRHSDLYAYNPLAHRHTPEITALARAATGVTGEFAFVPHSGPFARGIHATVQARLRQPIDATALRNQLRDFYAGSAFVGVMEGCPRLKDVVASNYARLGVASDGRNLVVTSVIDNLVKGAAGGGLQWLNRLLGFEETAGLTAPAAGWT